MKVIFKCICTNYCKFNKKYINQKNDQLKIIKPISIINTKTIIYGGRNCKIMIYINHTAFIFFVYQNNKI